MCTYSLYFLRYVLSLVVIRSCSTRDSWQVRPQAVSSILSRGYDDFKIRMAKSRFLIWSYLVPSLEQIVKRIIHSRHRTVNSQQDSEIWGGSRPAAEELPILEFAPPMWPK